MGDWELRFFIPAFQLYRSGVEARETIANTAEDLESETLDHMYEL